MLNDQPVLKITTTRQQFDAKLSTVQETIASYSAITFAKLGLHKTDDKGARKDQEEHKTKTYKAALSFLPEGAGHGLAQAEVDARSSRGRPYQNRGSLKTPRPNKQPGDPERERERAP